MDVVSATLTLLPFAALACYFLFRKQHQRLENGTEDYKRLFDGIPAPMYIYDDRTLNFLAMNDAALEQYGYSREEFLKMRLTDIRPVEEVPRLLSFLETLQKGHVNAGSWLHVNKAGRKFYVSIYTHHTTFDGNSARQVLIVNIDDKMRTEQALNEKSAELENILDSITDGFYTLNNRWEVTFINKAAEQALCCSRQEILGKNLWEFFPRSMEGRFYPEYERAMSEGVSVNFEEQYAPLGVWGSMNVYPTRDGIAVYFVDITERKKIQEKIYNDGQNLRAIINNTRDLIWSVDKESKIITGNQAFWDRVRELTGKGENEVSTTDFVQERLKVFFDSYQRAFKGEAFSIVRHREIDGNQVFEQLSFNPIPDMHGKIIGVNCFMRDITESQQYLHRIEDQNTRLREIAWIQSHRVRAQVANILGLAQLCDQDGSSNAHTITMINETAQELDKVIREITILTENL